MYNLYVGGVYNNGWTAYGDEATGMQDSTMFGEVLEQSLKNASVVAASVVEYFSAADLILGKAGGLSTTESINAGVPSLIVDKLPQQEIYNKLFLINHGCAIGVTSKNIAEKINHLIDNPDDYQNQSCHTCFAQNRYFG